MRQEDATFHTTDEALLRRARALAAALDTDGTATLKVPRALRRRLAALLRAEGQTQFAEMVFEQRFAHVPQLRRFGAQIRLVGSTALVRGVSALQPAQAEACDLRAAAALVIAALQAPGKSKITGLKHLRRGYDDLEGKLRRLGAEIQEYDWKSASM